MINGRYKLLGKEEMDCTCEFCGKKQITLSFTVRDLESDEVMHFGSSCIKKALGVTTPVINAEIKAERKAIYAEYDSRISAAVDLGCTLADQWRMENNVTTGWPKEGPALDAWNLANTLRGERNAKLSKFA